MQRQFVYPRVNVHEVLRTNALYVHVDEWGVLPRRTKNCVRGAGNAPGTRPRKIDSFAPGAVRPEPSRTSSPTD